MPTLTVKVSPGQMERIDAAAESAGTSRSEFVRNAALAVAKGVLVPTESLPVQVPAEPPKKRAPERPHGHALSCRCWTCNPPKEAL